MARFRIFSRKYRPFRRIVIWSFATISLLVIGALVWMGSQLPDFSVLENTTTDLSSVVYSRDGKVLGNYYANENRVTVELHQIPQQVKDALIATEDVRFYEHSGVDLMGQLRAISQILSGNLQGGSTLSMQLARNLYNEEVGRDRSLNRKVKEMVAAGFLERRYTKDEILMHYLNTVSFGGIRFGIQSATQYFFDKDVHELDLHEATMLVGMLKGTTLFNPYRNPDTTLSRRNTVINQMVKYGFLETALADSVKELPLGVRPEAGYDHNEGLAPYFRSELRKWLVEWCEDNGYDLYRDGLRIYTTIDTRLQERAEAAMAKHLREHQRTFDRKMGDWPAWRRDTTILTKAMRESARYNVLRSGGMAREAIVATFHQEVPMHVFDWEAEGRSRDTVMTPWDSLKYYARFLEAGVVTIEPSTGHVLAWVGGPDFRFFKYDHVRQGKRQVGSTFKPFVYTTAFDNNYSPCYEVPNKPFTWRTEDGKEWTPRNADGKYTDCVQLRKSLAQSINIPTAYLMKMVGPQNVAQYAYDMGIQSQLEVVPSLALGTTDLNVMELTSAYCTFANQGQWIEPQFVTRIEDRNGNLIESFVPNSRRALSEQTAYLMIDMLRAVVNGGTAASLRYRYDLPAGLDICGKTGTTQNHSDGWFMGFTPRYCTGVWVGHSDRRVHFQSILDGQGAVMALPIWGYYMRDVYTNEAIVDRTRRFEAPEDLGEEIDCVAFKRKNPNTGCEDEVDPYLQAPAPEPYVLPEDTADDATT